MKDSRKKKLFLLIVLLAISYAHSYAQVVIKNITIEPLNRATIFFSQLPEKYNSELSTEKTKIILRVNSSSVVEKARKINGKGIIENIYVQNFSNNLEISVILKEKRGYTIAQLPYSQALMVEVFDWSKLTTGEDNYRNGLLALENSIYSTAKKYFNSAFKAGNANSGVFLGLILMKEGYIDDAQKALESSERMGANIPELYAALSQINKVKNDFSKRDFYKRLFKEKTNLSDFPELQISNLVLSDSTIDEEFSILSKMNIPNQMDSTLDTSHTKELAGDSSKPKLNNKENKAITDSLFKTEDKSTFFEDWLKYAAILLGVMFIVIIIAYIKWRINKVRIIRKQRNTQFKENLKTAKNNYQGGSQATQAYAKAGNLIDKTIVSKDEKTDKAKSSEKQNTQDNKEHLQKIAEEIIAQKSHYDTEESTDITYIESDQNDYELEKTKPINAKLELALHLHEEQRKIKSQKLESLKTSGKEVDTNKLSEVAKKLGIEKSAIEASRNLSKLESDKKSLSKLAEKFTKREE